MDFPLIFHLVGLRYKLLWAQTRTRNGRIALLLTGYLLAILILVLFTAGGFGAAHIAVRSGHVEAVAQAVLGGLFLNALLTTVITGFGINAAFTGTVLRGLPLSATERLAARHLTGILEPVWILTLGLNLGVSTGMYVFGAGNFWLGGLAVVCLVIADYLLARVLATLIEWLTRVRGGTGILLVLLCVVCVLPALLAPRIARAHGLRQAVLRGLRVSPPFAAAALVTNRPGSQAIEFGLLLVWIAGLLLLLAAIERQAARPRSVTQAEVSWHDPYERVALIFGPAMSPLIGRSLRYYLRSNKVRFNYILAIPILALVTFAHRQGAAEGNYLLRGLGTFAIVGLLGTAVLSTNQFGFDSSGFRRYFLLPIPPAAILRASSYTALLLGGTLVFLALLLWMLCAPVPRDPRIPPMLLASGAGGLFLFNALSLWTSLLAPRRTNFDSTFGNQLSLPANVLLIGGVLAGILGTQAVEKTVRPSAALAYWWVWIAGAALAAALYVYSLRLGVTVFMRRKEKLMDSLEGRN